MLESFLYLVDLSTLLAQDTLITVSSYRSTLRYLTYLGAILYMLFAFSL